jgi:tetratricopeptide (TPR) repeat protein
VSILGSSQPNNVSHDDFNKAITEFQAVTRLDPTDTESYLILGRLYRLDNQMDKAEATFKQLLDSHPDLHTARVNLAQLYSDQGEYAEAVEVLKEIPESEMDTSLLYMLGYDELQTGKAADAEVLLEKALAQEPANQDVLRAYAEALMASGKTDQARQELQKVIQANPEDPRAYVRLSQLDRDEGRWDDARQDLAKAKGLAPDDPEISYQQAQLESTLGNDDKAIGILQDLLKQFTKADGQYTASEANNRAIFLERLGLIYRGEEKNDQAMSYFKQIVALGDAQAPRGEVLMVETLQLNNQPEQALAEAEAAVKKYPTNRQLLLERASLLGQQGHADEAVQQLQGLLKNQPSDRDIQIAIAQIYSQAKRYPEAEAAAQKALDLSPQPQDQEYAVFILGSVYEREKKFDQAEAQFKKVLSLDPLNGAAANYLGYMLADRGIQLDESVQYIKQALKLDPNNGAYLDSLGWAYYKMNRFSEAEGPLEKAAHQLSADPTVLDHLGHVYLRLGKKAEAQQEWERALQEWPKAVASDFTDQDAARLRKELDKLKRELASGKAPDDQQ